ncbi:SDR family NAD(P)-dependent oxidoreductase [Sphingomonas canadensis]|uniref:SDR family NAD(P)-dependent oxidoreductase n=1 Tax=Sphingomonas canadensis TaxID=1219257 RepID=A0ABW3HAK2_9SPHN|nr:SDR family NAD(P)-dependent oxidoreductase [Sphingomonas canadensis]MCW3837914.1 SDR family NAD(P)-dependent oxidoreductase [Sphingomonas canadensis]
MTDKPLFDQVALVTGASRGIGAATAHALAAAGAHVILTARTAGGLEEVEESIHAAGGTATIAPLDLAENEGIARLAAAIEGRWRSLDILVLNAATLGTLSALPAFDAKDFARVLTLNVSAQAALIGAFDPMLRKAQGARVIGVTSGIARNPRAYWGMYGASKAAFENLLLSYAEEMRNISGVRVALVDPGATRTAMRARAYPGEDPATLKGPEVAAEAIARLAAGGFDTGHYLALGK